MRSLVRGLIGFLIVASMLAILWKSRSAEVRPEAGEERDQGRDTAEPEAPASLLEATDPAQPLAREHVDSAERTVFGVVVTERGEPVAGAAISWVALQPEDQDTLDTRPHSGDGWWTLRRKSVQVYSAQDGRFEFYELPSSVLAHGTVLIASKEGFAKTGLALGADVDMSREVRLVMKESPSIEVRVLTEEGAPVVGATVKRVGASGTRGSPYRLERHVQDEVMTDEAGRALLPALGGEQAIWAEMGEFISVPWQGKSPVSVELKLQTSFTVGGTLRTERDDWGGFVGERNLVVSLRRGSLSFPLLKERALPDGEWGPLRVPLAAAESFELRLEGIPIATQVRQFPPPAAGEHVHFDLVARKEGCELWFFVHEEGVDTPALEDAEVVVWWQQASADSGPNFLRGWPRVDGMTYVGTFPPGRLFYEARAPGFAPFRGQLTAPADYALDLGLKRGGLVAGRVLLDERPARDFQVIFWPEGPARELFSRTFLGRADGSFEIDGVAPGDWRFQAASLEAPPTHSVPALVRSGERFDLTIEMLAPMRGAGRVVDRETGQPLADAEVEVLGSGGAEAGLPWGAPIACAEDGTFELSAFTRGVNHLVVRAPGYASAQIKKHLEGDFLDWGDIRLTEPQALEVRLHGVEQFRGDVAALHVYSAQGFELRPQSFDREGRVRFEGVPPGDLQLMIEEGAAEWTRLQLRLDAGKDWTFEHRIAGGKQLELRVVDESGDVDLEAHSVYVSTVEPSGVSTIRARGQPNDGVYVFDGLEASEAQIWIADNAAITATQTITLTDLRNEAQILLGTDPLRVRVVDATQAPLTGAWITLRSLDGNQTLGADDTDEGGWAELAGIPSDRLIADVHHAQAGWRFGVPLDASIREQEFVLDAGGSIELVVTDGVEPLADVTTRLETPLGRGLTRPRDTDVAGRVRYAPLGEGRYRIVCRRSDCWTVVVDVALAAGAEVTPSVTLPRLAEVELLVRSAEGTPLAGAEIELVHQTLGERASAWLEAESVQGTLRCAQDGRLALRGLPSGAYTWRITKPIFAEGSLRLAPGPNELELRPLP